MVPLVFLPIVVVFPLQHRRWLCGPPEPLENVADGAAPARQEEYLAVQVLRGLRSLTFVTYTTEDDIMSFCKFARATTN